MGGRGNNNDVTHKPADGSLQERDAVAGTLKAGLSRTGARFRCTVSVKGSYRFLFFLAQAFDISPRGTEIGGGGFVWESGSTLRRPFFGCRVFGEASPSRVFLEKPCFLALIAIHISG